MRGSFIIAGCAIMVALVGSALAEPDASKFVDRDVVVTNPTATFQIPNEAARPARVGYRYHVSHAQGSLLWVMRLGGWLKASDVVLDEEAVAHFSSRIKADPSAEHFYQRAVMWSVRKEYARAIADYEAALALKPEMAAAHSGRGVCYWALGRFDESLSIFNRAIELDPTNAAAFNNRGNVWRSMGQISEAMADYAQSSKLAPSHSLPRSNLGSSHLRKGAFVEAVADFDEALRIDPFDAETFNDRGFAWQQQGEYQRAIEDYQRAVRYDDRCHQAYNNAAWLRATCPEAAFRDGELAVRAAETACQLTEYRVWYCLATLAAAQAEEGAFDKAVSAQRHALGLLPQDVTSAEFDEQRRRLELYLADQPYRSGGTAPIAVRPTSSQPSDRHF